jgi:hypothetical protein
MPVAELVSKRPLGKEFSTFLSENNKYSGLRQGGGSEIDFHDLFH